MGDPDIKRKIVLLGDSAVGKTSLIRRFVLDSFDDKYITTIGTKITKKEIPVDTPGGRQEVTMMIWDILGQQGYTGTQSMSYVGTHGAIFVFDITRPETLESLGRYWRPELQKVAGQVPSILVANKADLLATGPLKAADVEHAAAAMGVPFFLSSAKTGEGVEALFARIASLSAAASVGSAPAGHTAAKEVKTLTDAVDMVITDFTTSFGDQELAMAMVRTQFLKSGLDISHPTKGALLEAIRLLAESEHGFKSKDEIASNQARRRAFVEKCQ
jgi:small GTP-binding protein